MQLEQRLGALKPALMLMLQKKCDEAESEDGGIMAVGSPKVRESSGKLPSINMGFKVQGKGLPPVSHQSPPSPDTMMAPPPLSPATSIMKKKLSMPRGMKSQESGGDFSDRGSSPTTPPLAYARSKGSLLSPLPNAIKLDDPLLDVPKYSKMFSIKGGNGKVADSAGGSMNSLPGALDETEEKLIQHLMNDI